jgi:hypothetical protein
LLREHWINKLGAPADFEEEINDFFDRCSKAIWASPDPPAATRKLFGGPKRGAPTRTAERDFNLATDIQGLIDGGKKVDEACLDVFERLDSTHEGLDPRTLRNIYFRNAVKVKAARAWHILVERGQ